MGHAVSKQGKAAGEKQQKAAAKEQTPAEIVADIRTSVEGALYVPVHRIAVLLSQYDLVTAERDKALARIEELLYVNGDILRKLGEYVEKNKELEAKNEEFRQVYEAENSSQSLTIERSEE